MVHTRRLGQSSEHDRQLRANWKRMKGKYPITRHVKKLIDGSLTSSSSSSDTSDSESIPLSNLKRSSSTQHIPVFSKPTTRRSLQYDPITLYNEESYMYDSEDSTNSETRILLEAGQLDCAPRDEAFSVPLNLMESGNFEKRQLPSCRTRHRLSLIPTKEKSTLKETLVIEPESSPVDENSSSEESIRFVEIEQRFKSLLKEKLSHSRQRKVQRPTESSESDSGNSEIEKRRNSQLKSTPAKRELPVRNIRTPLKYRTPETPKPWLRETHQRENSVESSSSINRMITRRSISVQKETNKETLDYFQRENSVESSSSSNRMVTHRSISVQKETNKKTFNDVQRENSVESSSSRNRMVTRQSISIQKESSSSIDQRVTRNTSAQQERNEKAPDDSQMIIKPGESDFQIKNPKISLTRADFTPEFLLIRQSSEISETSNFVASYNNINETTTEKETNGNKTVQNHQEIEDLLRQLEGSSDSEEESHEILPIKQRRRKVTPKKTAPKSKSSPTNQQCICHICEECFTSKESLHIHEDLHSGKKKRKCKHCDKTFTRDNNYVNHLRNHNIDLKSHCVNAFKCDICKKLFAYRHVLRRHQMMHENRVDFMCDKCGKRFVRRDYLKTHERLIHSENPYYECEICDQKFAYKHSKILHERTHTNEKPFKCRLCKAAFSRKDNFKKHKTSHEIKRARFICDECDEVFVNKFALQIHIQDHMKMKEIADRDDGHVEVIQVFINDDWD